MSWGSLVHTSREWVKNIFDDLTETRGLNTRKPNTLEVRVGPVDDHKGVRVLAVARHEEAAGICNAAAKAGLPVVISFTLETDGRLPSGETLKSAITRVDEIADIRPAWYMINCAHPDHFSAVVSSGEAWISRIGGLRANASRMSHAELDEAKELDDGDPAELGRQYRALLNRLPGIRVLGGCCGTDHRHIAAISDACHGGARDFRQIASMRGHWPQGSGPAHVIL